MSSETPEKDQKSAAFDQSGQTVRGHQVNVRGEARIEHVGDRISGDVVVTGHVEGDVQITYVQRTPVAPPPPPLRPPQAALFVGRENEIASYAAALEQLGIAVISGMAGVGKTTLAAELARRVTVPERLFWHSFHEGEGIDALLWRLAGFLAANGQEDLWAVLQNALLNNSRPPADLLFDYLIEEVRGRNYLLCLDDFQFLHKNALLNQLVERLRRLLAHGELKVIITSRQVPDFVQRSTFEPLEGLSVADLGQLLSAGDLFPEAAEIELLHRYTGGNAQMLTLAIDLLRSGYQVRELLGRLVEADDLEAFLMDEIESRLTRDERLVMSAVAVLQGYPAGRAAIEAVLDGRHLRRTVRDLSDRFLLAVTRGEDGRLYDQHAIVRDFFYQALDQRELARLHLRAGAYYREREPDILLAILHFLLGGAPAEAVILAEENVYLLLNKGQAAALDGLLRRIERGQLATRPWITVQLLSGQVSSFLGEVQAARESYLDALHELRGLPAAEETAVLNARIALGMAELLQFQEPREALSWAESGLAAGSPDSTLQAELNVLRGALLLQSGDSEEARAGFERSLALLPEGPSIMRARTLKNLAGLTLYTGEFDAGKTYAREALAISRLLHDRFQECSILSNYAIIQYVSGDWTSAIDNFKAAISIARQLGIRKYIVDFEINLSTALINTGAYVQAGELLREALPLALEVRRELNVMMILIHQAELYVLERAWEEAEDKLAAAEELARQLEARTSLPSIYSTWTEAAIGRREIARAEKYAELALAIARELNDPYETGIAWRAKGVAAQAAGQDERAEVYFRSSMKALQDLDPFQHARAQLALSALLAARADSAGESKALLTAARDTFFALGAAPDLSRAEQALAAFDSPGH